MTSGKDASAPQATGETIETSLSFSPKFDPAGLIPAIVTDVKSGDVLMFAYMNEAALTQTLTTGLAHFWSRSRGRLWMKGEESGNLLRVRDLRTDCDQDVLWLAVDVEGNGVACHTGARSCFYRRVVGESAERAALEIAALPHPREPRQST
jgi:phosphoribosyl-AMP cyclohydrolase